MAGESNQLNAGLWLKQFLNKKKLPPSGEGVFFAEIPGPPLLTARRSTPHNGTISAIVAGDAAVEVEVDLRVEEGVLAKEDTTLVGLIF